VGGECERCGTQVEQRFLEQWFCRITDYAGRLLDNLDRLDWSETTKTAQRNWIGRSEGAQVTFEVLDRYAFASTATAGGSGEYAVAQQLITVFTTRPDTLYGATYLVLAPEHPLVLEIASDEQRGEVEAYRERSAAQDLVSRRVNKEKTGVFTGAYATNPVTGRPIPIWVADYVLMDYGTGAIMAVPGHDERDHEFATTFGLEIVRVVAGPGESAQTPITDAAVTATEGARLVHSDRFDGMAVDDAKRAITAWLAQHGAGKAVTNYRLHDWCISRQRYWGPPIPVIYCDACGVVPVPEDQLPVLLPHVEDFKPDDTGISPLARVESWYRVPCPTCGKEGRRETDVSDTFLDSAWYFLRYPSSDRNDVPFDPATTKRWLPVHSYIGGNEHAVLHLLYSRFVTMVLHDMGYIDFEEPFTRFRAHGLLVKDGAKMSKSRGNVVIPDEYIEEWGADTFRTYLMFLGPFEEGGDFRDAGISGVKRYLDRLYRAVQDARRDQSPDATVLRKLHQTIKKVGDDLSRLSYNTAIAAMMEYMKTLKANDRAPHVAEVEPLVQLVAPFAPHLAEELWERLGHENTTIFAAGWPTYDPSLIVDELVEMAVQVKGKLRGTIKVTRDIAQEAALAAALAEPSIAKFVEGEIRKVVFVPGRLLNLVV